jgi:hypothetical protein
MQRWSLGIPLLLALLATPAAVRAADGGAAERAPAAAASGSARGTPPPGPSAAGTGTAAARPLPPEQDPKQLYGFALTRPEVDPAKILPGGPGRDGIPAVDAPTFASTAARDAVADDTPVLGVSIGGDARAYLLPILEVHQIVNDTVGGVPIAVTYDPLTGAPLVFDRRVDGRTLHFSVSGLLYDSGFLLYDRETQSLWSQFEGRAIAGELAGRTLARIPVRREDFASWIAREPHTRILIPPDPAHFDYNAQRYGRYEQQDGSLFPVDARDRRFHAKELVVGVVVDGHARAYLASLLTRQGGRAEDVLAGQPVTVSYDRAKGTFDWTVPAGAQVTEAYWFAWKAFHPDTDIWQDPGDVPGREP